MRTTMHTAFRVGTTLTLLWVVSLAAWPIDPGGRPASSITPARMARIGTVDERFQSYNVEMVEVTGGRFWKPYEKRNDAASATQSPARQPGPTPAGIDPGLFEYRPPIDLSNARLRRLAAALGPAYVRVSGTWANTTYFQDSDAPAPASPPTGFGGVLTRRQWRGVVDFARAVDAKIVTSFATGPGTRDAAGAWTPEQAGRLLAYTESVGGSIAAAEFMNEPNIAAMGGAPKGYDAAAYGRDIAVFRPFIKQAAPDMLLLGPGSVGEGSSLVMPLRAGILKTDDLLAATGPAFDVFSYHFYPAVSVRCAGLGAATQTTSEAALSDEWLSRPDGADEFYRGLRDRFLPGKALWLTETAGAACGGNPWASTFLDVFRYLDQHGRLARRGVQVIMHNTLASSDYGLLDENTLAPRPNYWAALLWRRLMGATVLDPGPSPSPSLHLYAHCLRGSPGGVALLAINTDRTASHSLELAAGAQRYTLTARNLSDVGVELNGNELKLGAGDEVPRPAGARTRAGTLAFAPASVTFLAVPEANNGSCR